MRKYSIMNTYFSWKPVWGRSKKKNVCSERSHQTAKNLDFFVISLKINANGRIITCSQFYKKRHSHYFRETPWKLDRNSLNIGVIEMQASVKPQMKIKFSPTKVRKFKGLICYWFLAQKDNRMNLHTSFWVQNSENQVTRNQSGQLTFFEVSCVVRGILSGVWLSHVFWCFWEQDAALSRNP